MIMQGIKVMAKYKTEFTEFNFRNNLESVQFYKVGLPLTASELFNWDLVDFRLKKSYNISSYAA